MKLREIAALDFEGSRFFTTQAIANGAAIVPAGTDVTDLGWPESALRTHLRRGIVIAKPKLDPSEQREAERDGALPELPESWDAPTPKARGRRKG